MPRRPGFSSSVRRLFLGLLIACLGSWVFAFDQSVARTELPDEARATLALIDRGGPFPHKRDGIVFNNYEKRLPPNNRGYYREYTVPTPGAKNRGARRIVAGSSGERYYTDDHYRSFRRIRE
jgi:ribonuclease T1